MSTLRVLVVYPHLPHYRFGVFTALAASPSIAVKFAAGRESVDRSIATVPLDCLPFHQLRNRWLGRALWQSGLVGHLLRTRYDVVVMLGDAKYLSTWVAAALLRLQRRRILMWTIGWHRPDHRAARIVRLAFYRLADGLLLYGEGGRRLGLEAGYPDQRMHVIGNSSTSQVSDPDPAEVARVDEALRALRPVRLLMVGRLTAVKSLDLLLRALDLAPDLRRRTTVLLAGDGPDEESLRSLAAALDVDLRMMGSVYSEDQLARLYRLSDLTVVPGAAGLTVVQSLAHGVPVVTHDSPYHQMPEAEAVVPGRTGSLFRRGDPADLARVLTTWLEQPPDRESQAAACRREVRERWSPDVHAKRIIEALEATVVGGHT